MASMPAASLQSSRLSGGQLVSGTRSGGHTAVSLVRSPSRVSNAFPTADGSGGCSRHRACDRIKETRAAAGLFHEPSMPGNHKSARRSGARGQQASPLGRGFLTGLLTGAVLTSGVFVAERFGLLSVNLQGKVIRVLHLNLTRVREPDYGLWLGWFPVFGLLFLSVSNCF